MKIEPFFCNLKTIKQWLLPGAMILVSLCFTNSLLGATYDLSGTWNYTRTANWAQGDINCNPGPDASGTCTISQSGNSFSFAFTSGSVCDPPGSCTFEGTVSGADYTCSTTDIVDDEGGSVTSTISFTASSATSAAGSGISAYTHPSGEWECTWGNTITLTRSGDDIVPDGYTLTVNTLGGGTVTLDPPGGIYDPGTVVELTANADPGWQFHSWTGDVTSTGTSIATVVMDSDKTVTCTFSALDASMVNIFGMSSTASGNTGVNETISYTIESANPQGNPVYYRWYYQPYQGLSSTNPAPWVRVQDYSLTNTCNYSFSEEGSYIIVVRAATDPANEPDYLPITGHVVTIGTGNHVNLGPVSSNASGTASASETVTFTVEGSNVNGDTIYYKWLYCAGHGTNAYDDNSWVEVQDYSTTASCDYVFPNAGSYVIVVRAVTDPENEPDNLAISGCVVNVE